MRFFWIRSRDKYRSPAQTFLYSNRNVVIIEWRRKSYSSRAYGRRQFQEYSREEYLVQLQNHSMVFPFFKVDNTLIQYGGKRFESTYS
ncbi:hypothetical protein HA466_0298500 [Hirschfeldia incana]|nr:hypothetical protein HA466_0298500 [Hirschfeldia incana]